MIEVHKERSRIEGKETTFLPLLDLEPFICAGQRLRVSQNRTSCMCIFAGQSVSINLAEYINFSKFIEFFS